MQGNQRRFTLQTLAVRRVAYHRAVRALRQWVAKLGNVFHFEANQFANTGAAGVALRAFDDAGVNVGTVKARLIRRQPLTGAGLRFGLHLFPESIVMLRPAAETPMAAV